MPHSDSEKDYWQKVEDERRKYMWHQWSTPTSTPDRQRQAIFRADSAVPAESPSYSYPATTTRTYAYPSAPPPPPPPPAQDPNTSGQVQPGYWSYHPHGNPSHPGYHDTTQHYDHATGAEYIPQPPAPPPPPPPAQHAYMYSSYPHAHYQYPDQGSAERPPYYYPQPPRQSKDDDDLVYEVQDTDVLCGRGAPTNYHPGNKFFRELVDEQQMPYLAARRVDKPDIALLIVEKIKERGGRFLKRTKRPGLGPSGHFCWQEIGRERAYEKTCQSLREGAPELRKRMAIKELSAVSVDESDWQDEENAEENQKQRASKKAKH